MKWPFNRIEVLIFTSVFPLFFLLHWNGFLGFFYEGIAQKIGSTTGFAPALVSALTLYLVVLVGYYFLKKIKHNLFANRWRAAAVIGGFILILGFVGYFLFRDFWGVDTCLDKGGAWNYKIKQCETIESAWTKQKFSTLRDQLPDLPPFSETELEHQAWVYAANKIFQDQVCTGNVYYDQDSDPGMFLQKIPVADGNLVKILCNITAYNSDFVMLLQRETDLSVVEFTEVSVDTNEIIKTKTAFGLDYDSEKKIFSMLYKLRGLGDCGRQGNYIWNTETKSIELQAYRAKEICDGKNTEWPMIYDRDSIVNNDSVTSETPVVVSPESKSFSLAENFSLELGQTATNQDNELIVTLEKFVYEPCTDVCVWEGPQQVGLRFQLGEEIFLFDEQLPVNKTYNVFDYTVSISETDYTTFVNLMIE